MTDDASELIKHDGSGKKLLHQRCVIHKSRDLQRHVAKLYRKEAYRKSSSH